jgi:polysaccharide export outer membrane protein
MHPIRLMVLAALASLAGCAATPAPMPGTASYADFPPPGEDAPVQDYRIGPGDTLSITTFQEKDLTLEHVDVDASGNILFPLVGNVHVAGLSSAALSKELETRFGARYLRDPQVSVIVTSAVSQKVTVEGSVIQAGVFDLRGQTTLLQAIALAKGPNRTARLGNVIIFRTIDGKRQAARFDVDAIRNGSMPDPQIRGDDVVVVPFSHGKGVFRDVLTALPSLGVFAVFGGI